MRLLRDQLARYRGVLIAVVVFQTIQTIATLYLPSLNADIIDKGVLTGDTAYIWRTGAVMLAVTLVQVVFAIAAVYFGVPGGDGLRARRAQRRSSTGSPTSRPGRSARSARRR